MNTRVCIAGVCAALGTVWAAAALARPTKTTAPKAPAPAIAPAPDPAPIAQAPDAAPAPVAPGALILNADADGLIAQVSGALVGLKKGSNRTEQPAGSAKVLVKTPAGRVVFDGVIVIPSGGEERVDLTSLGQLGVRTPADAKVTVDGKPLTAAAGGFAAELEPGTHSLLVTAPGCIGKKGSVDIEAGKKTTMTAKLDPFAPPGHTKLAWAGILGGGALIVAALVIESTSKFDEFGGDPVRWTLLGVGTAGFVGGTLLLKSGMDEAATPPTQDGTFEVKVSQVRGGAMAQLGMRF